MILRLMKYTLFALILVASTAFACNHSVAETNGEGIEFKHITLKEALALAEKENKVVFIDAYTTWCGPCKRMARKTFTNPDVAAYYNEHFINIKIDMEKGEGPGLEKKYDIYHYPTLLFLESNGKKRKKVIGYHEPAEFIRLGKKVMRKS